MTATTSPGIVPLPTLRLLRVVAAIGLALAGAIHLALTPGHLALSPALGIGFLAAGLVQLALSAALMRQHQGRHVALAAATSALFIALFLYDITVGLPLVSHAAVHTQTHSHSDSHSHSGEESMHHAALPIDPAALVAKSAEMVTLVSAGVLLARSRRNVTSGRTDRRL